MVTGIQASREGESGTRPELVPALARGGAGAGLEACVSAFPVTSRKWGLLFQFFTRHAHDTSHFVPFQPPPELLL